MRYITAMIGLLVVTAIIACSLRSHAAAVWQPEPAAALGAEPVKIDFNTQLKPIFEARCQPCHFNGGKVYATMPFDRPETIKRLGTKLFTRIKDEKEQQLIREFLSQN